MENKSHALAAGLFVIIVTALLAGLALWLTRDSANYEQYELSTKEGVSGLQPQAVVRYKGVAVGKVTRIGFDPQVSGNVLIRIAVKEEAPVSATTFAVLGFQGVTGLAHVLLDDADAPLPTPQPGPSGLPRLVLKPSPFGRLVEQAPAILGQVDEATRRVNRLLGDENQQKLTEALTQLGRAAQGVHQLTQRLDATVQQRLDPALAAVPPLLQDSQETMHGLKQAAAKVSVMAENVAQTTRRMNEPGGTLDQINAGSHALARATDTFSNTTLPRLNRATDETARALRQFGRVAGGVNDNPQLFLYGNGRIPPGPGEAGFVAPMAQP